MKNKLVEKLSPFFNNKLFLSVLVLKLFLAVFFISPPAVGQQIAFIEHFVKEPLSNPYEYFHIKGIAGAFPYPPLMLFIQSLPFFIFSKFNTAGIGLLDVFLLKIPLLIADFLLFYLLLSFFRGSEKSILWLYWCSPIILYSTYVQGTADIIPICLLAASLYLLLEKKNTVLSAAFLGLSLATKTGIIIVVPFYLLYVWKRNQDIDEVMLFGSVFALTECLLILPYVFSDGFWAAQILGSKQVHLPNINIAFGGSLAFYIPLAVFAYLVYKALSFRKITKDILFMLIGVSFTLFTTTLIPQPGWYVWCIPFIVYLFIKEGINKWMYAAFNAFYLLYFMLVQNSDYFAVFKFISPSIAGLGNPAAFISGMGLPLQLMINFAFTFLVAALAYISYIIWKKIIRRTLIFQQANGIPAIGISGDSGSGKTVLASSLSRLFRRKNTTIICGDDIHKWERGDENWMQYTHLNPLSNHIYQNYAQIKDLKLGKPISRSNYDHTTGTFTAPQILRAKEYIISEGLHTFFIQESNSVYDLKVYLKPDESLRKHWKILRDTKKRNQSIEKVLEHLKQREADSSRYISPQEEYADLIVRFEPVNSDLSVNTSKKLKKLLLKLVIDVSVDLDTSKFNSELVRACKNLKIHLSYPSHKFQRIVFNGKITPEQVYNLIKSCVPDYEEYGIRKENLLDDYHGILQAISLYCLDIKLKKRLTAEI